MCVGLSGKEIYQGHDGLTSTQSAECCSERAARHGVLVLQGLDQRRDARWVAEASEITRGDDWLDGEKRTEVERRAPVAQRAESIGSRYADRHFVVPQTRDEWDDDCSITTTTQDPGDPGAHPRIAVLQEGNKGVDDCRIEKTS